MNPVNDIITNTTSCIVESWAQPKFQKLFRVHNEKLDTNGDISFPFDNTMLSIVVGKNIFNTLGLSMFNDLLNENSNLENINAFLELTKHWLYPIEKIRISEYRCLMFLNRNTVIANVIYQVMVEDSTFGYLTKNQNNRIYVQYDEGKGEQTSENISKYRAKLIKETIERILNYSEWIVENEPDQSTVNINVVSVMGFQSSVAANNIEIKCGIAIDPRTGRLATTTPSEYLELRTNDIRLMAMFKHGFRVDNETYFRTLIERLGRAAVTVDLLEVKFSSPVQLTRDCQGSTKGASFLLYNSARLESLLNTFNTLVTDHIYPALPVIEEINFTLLSESEEWNLIFGYILTFPNLIASCLEKIQQGQCSIHLIVRYLSDFASLFSVYYRRVKILMAYQDHLEPLIHARIYLLMTIRKIFNMGLALLNIEAVQFM